MSQFTRRKRATEQAGCLRLSMKGQAYQAASGPSPGQLTQQTNAEQCPAVKEGNSAMKYLFPAAIAAALIPSVAHAESEQRVTEIFHIFRLETDANRADMTKALLDGMNLNISKSDVITPIVMGPLPEEPARMKLVSLASDPRFAGLTAMMGPTASAQFKKVTCEGAVVIGNAVRKVRGSQHLSIQYCLFPYRDGYELDIYAIDAHQKGGGLSEKLGRALGTAIVGTPDEWTKKTIVDAIRSLRQRLNVTVTYIEGQPAFTDTPWEDNGGLLPNTGDKATVDNAPQPGTENQP